MLAIARRFATLAKAGLPARTVRFVLFNAEEQGLVGSQAYARRAKARGEAIAAVWQMDMIGYNKLPPVPGKRMRDSSRPPGRIAISAAR